MGLALKLSRLPLLRAINSVAMSGAHRSLFATLVMTIQRNLEKDHQQDMSNSEMTC